MSTISLSLPSDGQTIDASDVNTPFNTIATAINGNLDNTNIVAGAAIDGTKIATTTITNTQMATAVKPVTLFNENTFDHFASGCVWTADAAGATLLGSMTSGVVYINGARLTVAAITGHAFTASKDTYVDFSDNGDGTALVHYTEASNNAASAALTANWVRSAIIVTGATNIAAATSVNQGQETMVLPIASSIPYAVTDSLGNLICPRDPNRKILGYRQVIADQSTASGTYVDITGLNLFVNIPTGRKINAVAFCGDLQQAASGTGQFMNILDVTASSAQIAESGAVGVGYTTVRPETVYTAPASGARNFKVQFKSDGTRTIHTNGGSTTPLWVKVELQ